MSHRRNYLIWLSLRNLFICMMIMYYEFCIGLCWSFSDLSQKLSLEWISIAFLNIFHNESK